MILPKIQICPQAPKLKEILRGRDCLQNEGYRVMDVTIKMTPLVKLKVGCCCFQCVVHMIAVRTMVSRPCHIMGAVRDSLWGKTAGPMAIKLCKLNLVCLWTNKRIPP